MKTSLTTLIILLFGTIVYSQKAKMKTKNIGFKYDVYAEKEGYENYTLYNIKIRDSKGKTYTYSEGNTAQAAASDINNMSGVGYPFRQNTLKNVLFFDVVQTSSTPFNKVVKYIEDKTTKEKTYFYQITAKQKYTVRILDVKNGNKLIKELNVEATPITRWPLTSTFKSVKLLNYDYKYQKETTPGFVKKIDAKLIDRSLTSRIGKDIAMVMHERTAKPLFYASYVNTKDPTFNRLDSASIYLGFAMEDMKINRKGDVKGNYHRENVQKNIKKAHEIYLEFNKPEYLNWFTIDQLKEKYRYDMKANLYFTSFLISDFAKANEIYDQLNKIVEAENIEASKKDLDKIENVSQSLRRTSAKIAFDHILPFRVYQVREERLYDEFKNRFLY